MPSRRSESANFDDETSRPLMFDVGRTNRQSIYVPGSVLRRLLHSTSELVNDLESGSFIQQANLLVDARQAR